MKIKSVKEQLIDMGFKTGDRIRIKGNLNNIHTIYYEEGKIYDEHGYWISIVDLENQEFEKVLPTKEELLEELKRRSKKFEDDEECFYIYWNDGRAGYSERGTSRYVNELYFDEHTATQVCKELNNDKEKTKILFDLED